MTNFFDSREFEALQELINGLSDILKINKIFIFGDLEISKINTSVGLLSARNEAELQILIFQGIDFSDTLIVEITAASAFAQGVTPKWLWDAYESGATIIRLRPIIDEIGNSFLRHAAQTAFEQEITLSPILGGLLIPLVYRKNGILSAIYNKCIKISAMKAAKDVVSNRPIAIIAAYNEKDIIEESICDLIEEGCDIVLLDNWSDDGTFEIIERCRQDNKDRILSAKRFPVQPSAKTAWSDIILAKEEIALKYPGRWIINADADEFRRSPIPGLNFAQALHCAQLFGSNRVNFTVLNFRPVDDGLPQEGKYRTAFKHFELPDHHSYFAQNRAWIQPETRVELAFTGGHVATFEGACDFPLRFWMKHIPLRSPLHAARKIVGERAMRWSDSELKKGWHSHYSNEMSQSYIWAAESLHRLDNASFQLDYGIMLATPLSRFFSPIWFGHKSEMRKWFDQASILDIRKRIMDAEQKVSDIQANHAVELRNLIQKNDALYLFIRSLELDVDKSQKVKNQNHDLYISFRNQLNSSLSSMIIGVRSANKRKIGEKRSDHNKRLLKIAFFRNNWYINKYPDVAISGLDPAEHYLNFGASEGRDPTSYFSTLQYLLDNPDVAENGINPLLHFLIDGVNEGRNGVHRMI